MVIFPEEGRQQDGLISLYFHIPFCTKKCHYCHFFVLLDKPDLHQQLFEGLCLEIDQWMDELRGKQLVSIYFGGGTPSLFDPSLVNRLLEHVNRRIPFDKNTIEITLEANPETITPEKMNRFRLAGINRVSIGIQTLDDLLLKKLGRSHGAETALDSVKKTADAGISNISIDLMYDIPGQTLKSWKLTLEQIAKLPITHLSLYNLTIEPQTVFFKYRESLQKELPDADSSTDMFQSAIMHMKEMGLEPYEISAFARTGFHSRHNVGYWTGRPFLGFGPSAFSYWKNRRFRSVPQFNRYIKALKEHQHPTDFSEELTPLKRRRELLTIALRLRQGVDLTLFEERNGTLDLETHSAIRSLISENFLTQSDKRVFLTEKGILFYDTVAVELI